MAARAGARLPAAAAAALREAQHLLISHLVGEEPPTSEGRSWQLETGRALRAAGLPQRALVRANRELVRALVEELDVPLRGEPDGYTVVTELVQALGVDAALLLEAWEEHQGRESGQLEQARDALVVAQRMEAAGLLAAGVAHDLNNVLAVLSTAAESMRSSEARPEDIDLVESAALRGRRLAQRLIGLARPAKQCLETVDAVGVLQAFAPFLSRMLAPDVRLILALEDGPAPVRIDPSELERAVMNPVINAQEAVAGRGTITLRTARVRCRPESGLGEAKTQGDCLRIDVVDDGCGMSEQVRRRAFEPLFTTRGAGVGTGLGLANVWSIVQGAGGTAAVESDVGVGSTISLWLPISEGPVSAVPPEAVAARGEGESILLVEDDGGVARACARMLRASGYDVRCEGTAAGALDSALTLRPDLILTDCVLPDGSGLDLILGLRALGVDCPVVMSTGLDPSHADPGGRLPPDVRLLSKAVAAAELLNAIHAALEAEGS